MELQRSGPGERHWLSIPRLAGCVACRYLPERFTLPVSRNFGPPRACRSNTDHLAKLHTPILYILGGEKDIAYNNGMDDFRRINHVPVFAANLNVGHGGTYSKPHGGEFAEVATAWLQWQLKEDQEAAKLFVGDPCGLAKTTGWKVEKKNIP